MHARVLFLTNFVQRNGFYSSFYKNLLSINDVQSLLQGAETLALQVVDRGSDFYLIINYSFNSCGLRIEFACERLFAILHGDGVTAFCVGRDVDVEANDVASVDGFLVALMAFS